MGARFHFRLTRVWPGDTSQPERRPCSTWPPSVCSSCTGTKLESPGAWRTSTPWGACVIESCSLQKWAAPLGPDKRWSDGGPASWTGPFGGAWRRAPWRSSAWRRSRCWRCGSRRRCLPPGRALWRSGPVLVVWTSTKPCSNTWRSSRSGLAMDPPCLMWRWGWHCPSPPRNLH